MRKFLLPVLMLSLLAACSDGGKNFELLDSANAVENVASTESSTTVYSLTEKKTKAQCHLSDYVKICLEGNATTGYLWNYKIVEGGENIEFVEQKMLPKSEDKMLCGSPSINEFLFKPKSKGRTKILMFYKRNWEKSPICEILFDVEIQ